MTSDWRERLVATLTMLRTRERSRTDWAYLGLWVLYLVCYPIAVIGVAFDVRPGFSMAWAGSILLFIQGAIAVLWLARMLGWERGGQIALIVALGAFTGETIGVTTGFPFGRYSYSDILFPRLPGSVPLPVIGAWLLVMASAIGAARYFIPDQTDESPRQRLIARIVLATVLGVGLDLVLEPVAVWVEGYWRWLTTGPYFGIPTSNFLGWATLSALLAWAALTIWGDHSAPEPPARQDFANSLQPYPIPAGAEAALWQYVLTAAMFTLIDLTHGLWLAAISGALLLLCLALRWRATVS